MTQSARRAQKITLAAAVFDKQGRILVDPDGLIPSTVVTGSFIQQSVWTPIIPCLDLHQTDLTAQDKQEFSTDHPHFLWMFQASRNWPGLSPLAEAMSKHLAQPRTEGQDLTETQGRLFREQFCVAAMRLADRLRETLPSAGVLWDQILPTGAGVSLPDPQVRSTPPDSPINASPKNETEDLAEKGLHPRHGQYGRGSLMFVVRRMQQDRDAERWSTVGYRFADIEQVSATIATRMQIQTPGLEHKLRQMALYADHETDADAGVHLGLFGIRARVGQSGFEVMVQREARNLLPSVKLGLTKLEPWQVGILRRFENMSMVAMDRSVKTWTTSTTSERVFVNQLSSAIQALRDSLQDESLENAIFSAELINLPSQSDDSKTMLVFSIVVPIHAVANNPDCEFVSLGLFKAHQLVRLHQSQVAFVQRVHRESASLLEKDTRAAERRHRTRSSVWLPRFGGHRAKSPRPPSRISLDNRSTDDSSRKRKFSSAAMSGSSSTVDLCHIKTDGEDAPRPSMTVREMSNPMSKGPFGGIMVSEVITVNVESRDQGAQDRRPAITRAGSGRPQLVTSSSELEMDRLESREAGDGLATLTKIAVADEGEGQNTFVDDLFQKCVEARRWHR